jgi:DNA-binding CsgD family transcriptional regulator
MNHLILAFYLLAIIAGTVSITQTVLIYLCYKKKVVKQYGFFLLALYLFLFVFALDLYARINSIGDRRAVQNLIWIFQAAGGFTFVFTAPYFFHGVIGIEVTKTKRVIFFAIDALVVVAAFADIAVPNLVVTDFVLNVLLFGVIAYGIVLIAVKLHLIVEKILKRALLVFVILSCCFFPLLYLDALIGITGWLSVIQGMEGFAHPLYFLILNVLTIVFGLKYFNRPVYMVDNNLSDYFCSKYGITRREKEIIGLLLDGQATKEIGDRLFLSAKTVENHVYNIYRKVNAKNRVQLFQLIRANALE